MDPRNFWRCPSAHKTSTCFCFADGKRKERYWKHKGSHPKRWVAAAACAFETCWNTWCFVRSFCFVYMSSSMYVCGCFTDVSKVFVDVVWSLPLSLGSFSAFSDRMVALLKPPCFIFCWQGTSPTWHPISRHVQALASGFGVSEDRKGLTWGTGDGRKGLGRWGFRGMNAASSQINLTPTSASLRFGKVFQKDVVKQSPKTNDIIVAIKGCRKLSLGQDTHSTHILLPSKGRLLAKYLGKRNRCLLQSRELVGQIFFKLSLEEGFGCQVYYWMLVWPTWENI